MFIYVHHVKQLRGEAGLVCIFTDPRELNKTTDIFISGFGVPDNVRPALQIQQSILTLRGSMRATAQPFVCCVRFWTVAHSVQYMMSQHIYR